MATRPRLGAGLVVASVLTLAGGSYALGLTPSGMGDSPPSSSTESGVPAVTVDAPSGWRPAMSHWSANTSDGEFSFTDMSYVTDSGPLEGHGVYVCVAATEQQSACPNDSEYQIASHEEQGFTVVIAQEVRKGPPPSARVHDEWADVEVSVE